MGIIIWINLLDDDELYLKFVLVFNDLHIT